MRRPEIGLLHGRRALWLTTIASATGNTTRYAASSQPERQHSATGVTARRRLVEPTLPPQDHDAEQHERDAGNQRNQRRDVVTGEPVDPDV